MNKRFKTTISSLLVMALLLMGNVTFAQKFAYVDSEYILNQLPTYRSAQTQLNELSEKWQKEIDGKYSEIDKLYKNYQSEKVLLTKEMQTKRENEIIEKERAAKKLQNDKFGYEGELFKERQELVKPIQDKVFNAINKVAKDNGLDFIFDKSGDVLMLVANQKYDRSDEVLEELGVSPSKVKDKDTSLPPSGSPDDDMDDNLPPD